MASFLKPLRVLTFCRKLHKINLNFTRREHIVTNQLTLNNPGILTTLPLLYATTIYSKRVKDHQFFAHDETINMSVLDKIVDYKCPASNNDSLVILDIYERSFMDYKLPSLPKLSDISVPEMNQQIVDYVIDPRNVNSPIEIEASSVLKKREKKMKKHQRKKWKKKHVIMIRKMRERKDKKKQEALQERINSYGRWAEEFDALEFITSEVEKAKKGGYRINQKKIFTD